MSSVSKFHTRDDGKSELRIAYRIKPQDAEDFKAEEDDAVEDGWITTASGRRVRQSVYPQWRKHLQIKSVSITTRFGSFHHVGARFVTVSIVTSI